MRIRSRLSNRPLRVSVCLVAFLTTSCRPLLAYPTAPQVRLTTEVSSAVDPHFGLAYSRACAVEIDENGVLIRRFTVHVQDLAALPESQRVGRFLAHLWSAANRRFGTLCSALRKSPVDVWLTRTGEPGGEQYRTNLYIYDFAAERSGIEWGRELAHEYGHYLLPGASGYTSPENWSNGILGERLFLRWLRDDLANSRLESENLPYINRADLDDFCAKQVTPLVDRIKNNGPDPAALARTDRKGMDAFTALMLYADDVYGSASLINLLDYLPPNGAAGARGLHFLSAFTAYVAKSDGGMLNLERNRAVLVYIPSGVVRLETVMDGKLAAAPSPTATVTGSGKATTFRSTAPGWRAVTVAGMAGCGAVAWKRVAP